MGFSFQSVEHKFCGLHIMRFLRMLYDKD